MTLSLRKSSPDAAFDCGWLAADECLRRGGGVAENPFRPDSLNFCAWHAGWHVRLIDAAREAEERRLP